MQNLIKKLINFKNILAVFITIGVFSFSSPSFAATNATGGVLVLAPSTLSYLTNQERLAENIKILSVNKILNKAAQMKAKDMAEKGYFSHTSPTGKDPWYWIKKAGYTYEYAGENLVVNFTDSKDIMAAWMASPSHKANIVDPHYTEIGTGMAVGMYEGREAIFIAQVYANPGPEPRIKIRRVS